MKKDFYEALSIKRSSTDDDISTAYNIFNPFIIYSYKKLALRHHPLKNPSDMAINMQKFHEICEAYEVLSNCKSSFLILLRTTEDHL
jgi:DnaJ-class molecular chaperone